MTQQGKMFLNKRIMDNARNNRDSADYRNNQDGGTRYNIYKQDEYARGRDNNDYGMHTDYVGNPDYGRGYADGLSDGRRGVKGTGPYSRMDRADNDMGMYDMRDMNDYNDYGHKLKLSAEDLHKWKSMLENDDGTTGPRFNLSQTTPIAERLGIKFNNYTPEEFCMAMNMFYSDFCTEFKNFIPPEREAVEYAKIARRFMEDKDASAKGSEKLAIYYHCIVAKQ